jgi:ABC-2 type transport system permease protein
MSTPPNPPISPSANAVPGTSLESQAISPSLISPGRRFYWSVRRELWENRSIWIAPLAVSALTLLGFLISTFRLPGRMRDALALDPLKLHQLIERPYDFSALLIMGATLLVAIFYCLDALHGERRDRSILFWKSLPISDFATVLSKAAIPLFILPLITFAFTVATQSIIYLINSAVLLGSGLGIAPLWNHLSLFQSWAMLLYHLLAIHSLWYAPFFAWLLMVSAWARRAPFLWAALPLLAIGVVEKIAFSTSYFGAMLLNRIAGAPGGSTATPTAMSMASLTPVTLLQFLGSAGLWSGLAVAALFLVIAVRLRQHRQPI